MKAIVSVENPTRSYLWSTKFFKKLIESGLLREIIFQQCMWGSTRNKWSTWYVSHSCFDEMAILCDGQRQHEGWTIKSVQGKWHFSTSDEAEYPQQLCDKVAEVLLQQAIDAGVQQLEIQQKKKQPKTMQVTMASAGRQPRGDRFPAIIPEFAYQVSRQISLTLHSKTDKRLSKTMCDELQVPYPAKLLQVEEGKNNEEKSFEVEIGIWRTPSQFVEQALQIQHPFDDSSSLDDANKLNMFQLLTEGAEARATRCKVALGYYKQRAVALQSAEDELHHQLDEDRKRIVQGKRFIV